MKPLAHDKVWETLRKGGSARLESGKRPMFSADDPVVVKELDTGGHIRLPGYVRGRSGSVAFCRGEFIFPDRHAEGVKVAEHLYSVRFESQELWGADSDHAVYVDLFESYLQSR